VTTQQNLSRHGAPPGTPSGADLTAQAIATHLQRGRYLRSEALYRGIGVAIGTLRRGYQTLREGLHRHNAQRAAIAELSRMNKHMLADIGIRREQIPMVVEGMLERRASSAKTPPQTVEEVAASTVTGVDCGCGAANDEHCPPLAA